MHRTLTTLIITMLTHNTNSANKSYNVHFHLNWYRNNLFNLQYGAIYRDTQTLQTYEYIHYDYAQSQFDNDNELMTNLLPNV